MGHITTKCKVMHLFTQSISSDKVLDYRYKERRGAEKISLNRYIDRQIDHLPLWLVIVDILSLLLKAARPRLTLPG